MLNSKLELYDKEIWFYKQHPVQQGSISNILPNRVPSATSCPTGFYQQHPAKQGSISKTLPNRVPSAKPCLTGFHQQNPA
ncbi:hypothetical protein RRG08_039224 [Elysia crispata]|uniref:Uncharacterized protein n=1 Tax=Elysia crispata TaxID=231223 RepID=A0AAE1BDU3_9GAST|nr:hypothetical protein RRG08_039224 [Elysia crispata]